MGEVLALADWALEQRAVGLLLEQRVVELLPVLADLEQREEGLVLALAG
jgi:hypothetical protein